MWGHGFFKYQACDYCDDVVAETADVTVGDAWLPQYVKDSSGTNVVIVRNPLIQDIIQQGIISNRIHLDFIDADNAAKSQDAGLRHRREGLAYRLHLKDKAGLWRPEKRVKAQFRHFSRRLRKIQKLRVRMATESHFAFEKAIRAGRFIVFRNSMESIVKIYDNIYKPSWWQQLKSWIKKYIKR